MRNKTCWPTEKTYEKIYVCVYVYMYVCIEEAKYACNYAERERKREMLWADKRKVSHKLSSA